MSAKALSKGSTLADSDYLLEKFKGKGGWTYAEIPEISQDKSNPFGWVLVKGSIDDFELKQYKLMPMGNGKVFLPVKAEIRKKIKKQAGDYVKIILYPDEARVQVPEEIIDCLREETGGLEKKFLDLSDGQKKVYLDWIYKSKTEDTKAKRILKVMDNLKKNIKFYDRNS